MRKKIVPHPLRYTNTNMVYYIYIYLFIYLNILLIMYRYIYILYIYIYILYIYILCCVYPPSCRQKKMSSICFLKVLLSRVTKHGQRTKNLVFRWCSRRWFSQLKSSISREIPIKTHYNSLKPMFIHYFPMVFPYFPIVSPGVSIFSHIFPWCYIFQ